MSIAEMIQGRFEQLTPAERKPAGLLLSNYPMLGLETLSTFADRAGVSHPTILRFISKLGYAGYPSFQAALRSELEARLKSPLAKHDSYPSAHAGEDDLLSRYAESVCGNIRHLTSSVPRREFYRTLELLEDTSNTVLLLGGRITGPLAAYAYTHIRMLRPNVHLVTGHPQLWSEYIVDMDRKTVLMVFDIRRYQDDLSRFAAQAVDRGARVVLVTDNWLSPIAGHATHVFTARIEVPSTWDSVAAMQVLVEMLVAGLDNRRWSKLKGRLQVLERLRILFGVASSSD